MKTVLVTGGCGFLGSHVCEYYFNKGWNVISYDNMTKHELSRTGFAADSARMHNYDFLRNLGVEMVVADVTDFDALNKFAERSDYIVHTAAQPAMTISWEEPRLDFESNLLGSFNVLEVARKLKIPAALCASVHVYGNDINSELTEGDERYVRTPEAIDEGYPTLGGTLTPLHATKAGGDIYVQTYIDTYNVDACSFRLSGIYGTRQFGGEDHGWVANFAIRSVYDRTINVFGSGKQVRDVVYVTDVCEAFDAFYKSRKSGVYNIGGGISTSISLLQSIDIIEEINGVRPDVNHAEDRHGDLRYFVCDIQKAKNLMGWQPKIMPKEGISLLIEWIRDNKEIFVG